MGGAGYGNHGEEARPDAPAERTGDQGADPGAPPPAGPHADPALTNKEATPGAGSLPDDARRDVDGGTG